MEKTNCWEYSKCGREVFGVNVNELGLCPASIEKKLNGTHGGKNGGRACWVVAGTLCSGMVQGTYANTLKDCVQCDFFNSVKREEGSDFIPSNTLMNKLPE